MRFRLIEAEKANFPIRVLCEVLEVSPSGFYAWRTRPRSERDKLDAVLAVEVAAVHAKSGRRYGSPRVHGALKKRGLQVSAKRVARLMRERGLVGREKRRFRATTDSNHDSPIAPNLLRRAFRRAAPDEAWVGDVTYIETREGWCYLAVLLDLFSRRVVGWAVSATNDTALALAALDRAVRLRRRVRGGLLHHTDRGSPYASEAYRRALAAFSMTQSMSRAGDCWDNAVAESFFATLRAELVDHETYATEAEAHRSLGDYIEAFYNTERLHSSLGFLSPIEFELKAHAASFAA